MSVDAEILLAIRQGGHLGQQHLKLLARVGSPHSCCFCGHDVLALQEKCGATRQFAIGEAVYVDGAHIGSYLGDKKVLIHNNLVENGRLIPGMRAHIELPEAWKPAPCACDHSVATPERTMQEYQTNHGVDLRVLHALNPRMLYHVTNQNRDGTPQRWRISGQIKTWKTRPGHFKVPIKHGLHSFDHLEMATSKLFRTEAR